MLNPSAVLYGPLDVRIEDRPVPKPAPGQVLVEIAAVGICGSDVHYYEHGRIGDYVVRDPMIIGHESAGTVVDVGDGVDRSRVGELVALEPGVPCRTCTQCPGPLQPVPAGRLLRHAACGRLDQPFRNH